MNIIIRTFLFSLILSLSLPAIALDVVGSWERSEGSVTKIYKIFQEGMAYGLEYEDGSKTILKSTTPMDNETIRLLSPTSKYGDGYAILKTGQLVIFDNEGVIATAEPIETNIN